MATASSSSSAAEWVCSLAPTELAELQLMVAAGDRTRFAERLKSAGFAKMGQRLAVEARLRELSVGGPPKDADAGARATVVAAPSAPAAAATEENAPAATELAAAAPAVALEDATTTSTLYIPAATFEGARKGYIFKTGSKGVGYYRDLAKCDPAQARMIRKHLGNLSWLSDETNDGDAARYEGTAGHVEVAALPPQPSVLTPHQPIPMITTLALARPPPEAPPPGRLSEKRRKELQRRAGPFDPELKDGKYTEKGEVVKITCGNANGKWGLVTDIKMNQFTVKVLPHMDPCDASMFHDLKTTGLILDRFIKAKREWDARAPLARKTLEDDAKGHVHTSWKPSFGSVLRLTDRSSAQQKPKPGSGSGYYYAAVTSDQRTMPVAAPQRIDSSEVQRTGSSEAISKAGATKSDYYYAHRRKIDFSIPTPLPQRLE